MACSLVLACRINRRTIANFFSQFDRQFCRAWSRHTALLLLGSCEPTLLPGDWNSAKASMAAAALRARVAELARKADLAQTLLGNLVPVSMRDLATTRKVQNCSGLVVS